MINVQLLSDSVLTQNMHHYLMAQMHAFLFLLTGTCIAGSSRSMTCRLLSARLITTPSHPQCVCTWFCRRGRCG
jgi:hypothetical protein